MLPWNLLIIGNFDGEINNFVSIAVAIAHGYDKYVPYNNLYKGMYGFYYLVKVTTYVHKDYKCIYYCILSYTCSIWAGKLYWLDNVLLYTVTGRNIAFSDTFVICYLLSFGNLIVHPVHFLLAENINRRNQGIIIYFYYLIQNINVNGLMCVFSAG